MFTLFSLAIIADSLIHNRRPMKSKVHQISRDGYPITTRGRQDMIYEFQK